MTNAQLELYLRGSTASCGLLYQGLLGNADKTAYSLGIKDDSSWDSDIARRGIEDQYDDTIDRFTEQKSRFHWSKIGIAAYTDLAAMMETLPNSIRQNGHEADGDPVLKMDIEGAEWDVFGSISAEEIKKFR